MKHNINTCKVCGSRNVKEQTQGRVKCVDCGHRARPLVLEVIIPDPVKKSRGPRSRKSIVKEALRMLRA